MALLTLLNQIHPLENTPSLDSGSHSFSSHKYSDSEHSRLICFLETSITAASSLPSSRSEPQLSPQLQPYVFGHFPPTIESVKCIMLNQTLAAARTPPSTEAAWKVFSKISLLCCYVSLCHLLLLPSSAVCLISRFSLQPLEKKRVKRDLRSTLSTDFVLHVRLQGRGSNTELSRVA